MPRSYSDMETLVLTKLADTAQSNFLAGEVAYQMADCLKEYTNYRPHKINLSFDIESRTGTDVTATANKLTDLVKLQFVAGDVDKVVHNTTQNTWAVVLAYDSTSVLSLSADIMTENDNYAIYNKRCYNSHQIYIDDILPQLTSIESVEYPIGNKRNFEILSEGVLEIDLDSVVDSNANTAIVSNTPDTEVIVRAKRPHILSEMTDFAGAVSATAGVAAASTIDVISLASSAAIAIGAEFNIAGHRQSYITSASTAASTAGAATISFYPPLEAAAASASVVTFTNSTLKPSDEDTFADLVAARLAINKASKYISNINITGTDTGERYQAWGERKLAQVLGNVRHYKQTTVYPRG